jgi:hypothetical protein
MRLEKAISIQRKIVARGALRVNGRDIPLNDTCLKQKKQLIKWLTELKEHRKAVATEPATPIPGWYYSK